MHLLKYEFYSIDDDAYYYAIGQLVKKVRHYRENVSIDEFQAAIPELKKMEEQIQEIDLELGEDTRNYIQEIMEELSQESEIEQKLLEEIERSAKSVTLSLYDSDFSMSDFSYEFRNNDAVYWVEFYGYKEKREPDGNLLVIREVFRSVCYKFDLLFIDCTLTDR